MAVRQIQDRLIEDITDNVLQKYSQFSELMDTNEAQIHKENIQQINASVDFGNYFNPSLDDVFIERTEILDILHTCGNLELNKVLLVLSRLCHEMYSLAHFGVKKFVPSIILYGENDKNDLNLENSGTELLSISKFLPILFDLMCYLRRCYDISNNMILQLQHLFTNKNHRNSSKPFLEVAGARFDNLFQNFGLLCVSLINIEEVLVSQTLLTSDFVNFKRIIELVNTNSANKFNVALQDIDKLKFLYTLITSIEKDVIDNNRFFRQLIDSLRSNHESITQNTIIRDKFASYIRDSLVHFESDNNRFKDGKKLLSIASLFVVYTWIFRKEDRKLLKMIYDTVKKFNCIYICLRGHDALILEVFLNNYLPKTLIDKKIHTWLAGIRDTFMKSSFPEKVRQLNVKFSLWCIAFEECLNDMGENLIEVLGKQLTTLEDGLDLALNGYLMIKYQLAYHLKTGKSMIKNDLLALCKLVNILKAIKFTFMKKKGLILIIISRITQYLSYRILSGLSSVKKRLLSEVKKYSEKKLDVLSAIILASNCSHGPILTIERQILISLCLSISCHSMVEVELTKISTSYRKIKNVSKIWSRLEEWTNCEFMYFNRPIIDVYFLHCAEELENTLELKNFFTFFNDCAKLLIEGLNYDSMALSESLKSLEDDAYKSFKSNFLDKLCTSLETELRIQVHSHLKLDDQSPFKRNMPAFSFAMNCEGFRIMNRLIRIRDYVENHLNEIAYNLTAIALHDWQTYESMLSLAESTWDLKFVTSQLPTQTIGQGLDILEITRNIHIFVSRYMYNLNNQMFIERSSESKSLNVLLIRHVSNSIQTHGFGMINTAVNFAYQFLKSKLNLFTSFLYGDKIKSRLIKDLKMFRESKSRKFPFERAENLIKGIQNLGLDSSGQSFLDRFRILISEIGNTLGFVRMLRSGALHCSSNSVSFVPDLEDLGKINFQKLAEDEGLNDDTIEAAKNLDRILSILNRNFTEATDYFRLLVEAFKALRSNEHHHLKNFYIILPALTLNYVEHLILCKENIFRKNNSETTFTDDGFPMGVAYVLACLDQNEEFDGLEWFTSVKDKIKSEISSANGKSETAELTTKRLECLQNEFDLLRYNLTNCKILFRNTQNIEGRNKIYQ